jgi:hypothetical protein
MLGTSALLLIAALAATSAFATPYIKYGNDGVPIFGTLIHYSNVSFYGTYDEPEFRGDPINGNGQEDAAYTLNSIVGLRFSGNDAGVSGAAVPYSDAILYAQAISDTINAKGVGLIDGGLDGGWGELEILGKAVSERNDLIKHPNGPVRSYTEATADAYLTFKILDDNAYEGEKVLVKFVIETDLHFEINEAPTGALDRYVNFATYGGLIKQGKPDSTMKFNLSTDDTPLNIEGNPVPANNPDAPNYFVMDDQGKLINLIFDDPARPDQWNAGNPLRIVDLVKGEANSGRGGFIPELTDLYGTARSWPDTGSYLNFVNLDQLQELLLDDPLSPANDPLIAIATDPRYSVGNETFNGGQLGSDNVHAGSRIWYFWADLNTEYAIYCQLSANIATDGDINGQFGSLGDVTQLSKLYYHLEIAIPEPTTVIMVGLSLAGLATIIRKKFKR